MTTIVNTPTPTQNDSAGGGWVVGIIAIVVFTVLFLVYGVPALRRATQSSAPQINVPDQIDVNVNPNNSK